MSRALQQAPKEPQEVLGPLDEPGFTFTATGLKIESWVTFEQWELYGRKLQLADKGIQWALGDWVIFGEGKFKERAAQAVEFTGLKVKTLQNYATVAKAIDQSRRRDSELVDFATHSEVASLPEQEQEKILDKAEAQPGEMTRKQVRREVHRAKRQLGREKSEIELLHTPEVQEWLDGYMAVLTEWEESVPLTATFLRQMVQTHKAQAHWQKERSVDADCEVILMAVDEYNGISDDDLFQWLQDRGYYMRDPELDERLEYMKEKQMITETDAGPEGKQDARRGKLPTFYVRYFKKRPKITVVPDEDEDEF